LIGSRLPTSRPTAKVGKYSDPRRQDAPWGDLGETNGEPAGLGRAPGALGPAIYANGNYGFVYHRYLIEGVATAPPLCT
jgi:hypothetical protein